MNDRDGLSDSTLLHFAAKSGASGVGDIEEACRIVSMLIGKVRIKLNYIIVNMWFQITLLYYMFCHNHFMYGNVAF